MNIDEIRHIEIEQSVLGAILNDSLAALAVKNRVVKEKDFYLDNHKEIFKAINKIFTEHNKIDLIMLLEYIKSKNLINKVGGIAYVTEIAGSVISTSNIDNYVDILLKYSTKREMYELSRYIQENLNKENVLLRNEVHSKVLKIYDIGSKELSTEEYGAEFLKRLEERATGQNDSRGIPTGLIKLDEAIGGFDKAELITLFAFSGVGKTTLAIQVALNMLKQNKKVLFFSLEMPPRQIIERMVANLVMIDSNRMRKGEINDSEWVQVTKETSFICGENRVIFKNCKSLDEIMAQIQLEKLKNNIDIVFIDYITLIQAPEAQRKDLTIANITQKLKSLSIALDTPIVALAQAKQSVQEKNSGKYEAYEKLSETDIAESASIYRDSDKVIGMYRNVELDNPTARQKAHDEGKLNYNSKDASINPYCVNLLIKKCRNGTKKDIALQWDGEYYRISNCNW